MTSAMLLYLLTISLLLVLAAVIAEWLLTRLQRPARGAWAAALVLCVALPFMPPATPPVPAPGPVTPVETAAAPSGAVLADPLAPVLASVTPDFTIPRPWFYLASAIALSLLLVGWALLALRSRHWPTASLDGVTVRRAPATGPAVVGFVRPQIVVPDWAFTLPDSQRRMLLAHEQSHIAARDPLILLGAGLIVAAMPWNPLLWFALSRLRGAIEIDCDRRVLATGETVDGYARCLVDSVTLASGGPVPAIGSLSLSTSHLERRVALMLRTERPMLVVSIAAALAGVALVTSAVTATPPVPEVMSWRKAAQMIDAQPYKRAESYYNRLLNGKVSNTEMLYGVFYDNWSIRDPKAKGC
jgi:beta-lactamase regulating signal transducer with metallopeptidase domain